MLKGSETVRKNNSKIVKIHKECFSQFYVDVDVNSSHLTKNHQYLVLKNRSSTMGLTASSGDSFIRRESSNWTTMSSEILLPIKLRHSPKVLTSARVISSVKIIELYCIMQVFFYLWQFLFNVELLEYYACIISFFGDIFIQIIFKGSGC